MHICMYEYMQLKAMMMMIASNGITHNVYSTHNTYRSRAISEVCLSVSPQYPIHTHTHTHGTPFIIVEYYIHTCVWLWGGTYDIIVECVYGVACRYIVCVTALVGAEHVAWSE